MGNDGIGLLAEKARVKSPDGQRGVEHEPVEEIAGRLHAEIALERHRVHGDLGHQGALGRGGQHHVVLQPLDERRAVRRRHGGEEPVEPPRRVRHHEVSRVNVALRDLDLELELHVAPRPAGHGGAAAVVLGPVGDEHEVGGEQVAVLLGEGAEVRAADLFLTVEDELHVHARGQAHGVHGRERFQVRPDGALVVGRAARVEAMLAERLRRHRLDGHDGRRRPRRARRETRARSATAVATPPAGSAWCRSGNR